jgi:hypothetical protein
MLHVPHLEQVGDVQLHLVRGPAGDAELAVEVGRQLSDAHGEAQSVAETGQPLQVHEP